MTSTSKFPDRDSAAIFNMHINKDNLTPQRPLQEQNLDLTLDSLDDDQVGTQQHTHLSLSEAESQQNT